MAHSWKMQDTTEIVSRFIHVADSLTLQAENPPSVAPFQWKEDFLLSLFMVQGWLGVCVVVKNKMPPLRCCLEEQALPLKIRVQHCPPFPHHPSLEIG